MKVKEVSKKLAVGLGAVALVAGLAVGAVSGALMFPKEVTVIEYQDVIVENEIIKEVPVNVTVEKLVDNGNLDLVTKYLEDAKIFEDAADVVEEIKAEDAAIALAIAEIEAEGFDMLEDKSIFKDEDDLEIVKFYDNYDDIVVVRSDFDDDEYRFKIEVKVEDYVRDVKKKVVFTVDVEDGDVELRNVKLA